MTKIVIFLQLFKGINFTVFRRHLEVSKDKRFNARIAIHHAVEMKVCKNHCVSFFVKQLVYGTEFKSSQQKTHLQAFRPIIVWR